MCWTHPLDPLTLLPEGEAAPARKDDLTLIQAVERDYHGSRVLPWDAE